MLVTVVRSNIADRYISQKFKSRERESSANMSGMDMFVILYIQLRPELTAHPRLNQAEQRELQGRMEKKQMKDFMNVRQ